MILGGVIGDITGKTVEKIEMRTLIDNRGNPEKQKRSVEERLVYLDSSYDLFPEDSNFTDDTVMLAATADTLINSNFPNQEEYAKNYKKYGRNYAGVGYGKNFREWLQKDDLTPNDSFGNGTAMRVSPVAFAFDTLGEVLEQAKISAQATHGRIEATIGAQAVASAIFLARKGYDKKYIKKFITQNFNYNLEQKIDEIRPNYKFDATCQGSVPQSIIAFLESNDYEDTIRKALSIGGDSDTIACISGSIAAAYYKEIPKTIEEKAIGYLDKDIKNVLFTFKRMYNC